MTRRFCLSWMLTMALACQSLAGLTSAQQALSNFKQPSRDFSNGPLWVWNDMLTEAQIRDTLHDLAGQDVKQVWVHPRPGLMTPYLSEDWFRLWKVTLREAAKLDMNVWIYDENSYPSGFAGGLVPEAIPESRGRGITFGEISAVPKWDADLIGIYRLAGRAYENVTARVKAGESLPESSYLVARQVRAANQPWNGNRCYVNLLSPGVTEKFIELTHERYRKELGEHFGRRIPGIFTDEPNIRPAGGWPWSEVLAAEFQKRWGYSLLDHLPSLNRPVGDWRKVRHNYFQVLHEQFVEHWARPNFEYCATNDLEWTGHYWDHEWPNCFGVPDNMAMYAWHQRPAIDCLMNQYKENTHAQFGNVRMVRELSSVANQLGRKRTLCETYGAGGWDLRFEDMKRIGDWLQVLGVNTINEHLSYITLRGARKRDHPQSFSYHEPWWKAYHVSADYFARLSAALTQGEQINHVLVLEPTTTAWMYQGDQGQLGEISKAFFDLLLALESAQVEYDLVSEDILERYGKPGEAKVQFGGGEEVAALLVGQREYGVFLIPPFTENLNRKTHELLRQSAIKVLSESAPSRLDGNLSGPEQSLNQTRARTAAWIDGVVSQLAEQQKEEDVFIERAPNDPGILFHMRRQLEDGELLFLVNSSIEQPSRATVSSRYSGVEQWDPHTGDVKPYPSVAEHAGIRAQVNLPPSGSLLLFLSNHARSQSIPEEIAQVLPPIQPMSIKRLEENVLTLDYVDVTARGETKSNSYFYPASQFVWKKNGLDRNPWDSAVQFKDELISRTFPEESGFEATYKFRIKGDADAPIPRRLNAVIERPDLYTVTLNGKKVKPNGKWWLDKAFGRIDISKLAQPGENRLTIKASPFTIYHELEPAYIVGDFSLEPTERGFIITPDRPLELGQVTPEQRHSIRPEGTMWLSAGVGFNSGTDDRAPWLLFDLGRTVNLSAILVWNYNENHVRDLTSRGARYIRITAGEEADSQAQVIGKFELTRGNDQGLPQSLSMTGRQVRFVRFEFLSNYGGIAFPFTGKGNENLNDNAFVGLAEVHFLDENNQRVKDTRVARFSSELPSHSRLASCLVDGSGLDTERRGWNLQGHPFYGGAVAYSESFLTPKLNGRYLIGLPSWWGSVARVTVNGKLSGWITAPPFECDITRHVRRGENQVEVAVFGTLKNTLGPHHGNPALGAAWPSQFRVGPEQGPPPGAQYSTVAYGLFKPMVLKNLVPETRTARAK